MGIIPSRGNLPTLNASVRGWSNGGDWSGLVLNSAVANDCVSLVAALGPILNLAVIKFDQTRRVSEANVEQSLVAGLCQACQ